MPNRMQPGPYDTCRRPPKDLDPSSKRFSQKNQRISTPGMGLVLLPPSTNQMYGLATIPAGGIPTDQFSVVGISFWGIERKETLRNRYPFLQFFKPVRDDV